MQERKEERKKNTRFNPEAQEDVFDHGVLLMPSEL
jgi:hypothetical protein